MALDLGSTKKTLIGYHNKKKNSFGLIEKNFPVSVDEDESLFTLTRDHFFTITSPQIDSVLKNFLRYKNFNDVKRLIANILVLPGLVIAFGYILKYSTLLDSYPAILKIFDSSILSILFGISILSVIILWHDFFEDKSHPIQLPKVKKISQKDIDEIKATGFKFGRYSHLETINFADEQILEYLCIFTKNSEFQTLSLYKDLIENNFEVQQIIRKSGIELDTKTFEEEGVTEETVPNYPQTAIKSLLTYAIEEALLTESKELQPQHLFLAITKIYPSLQKLLKKNNVGIDILREVCVYNNGEITRNQKTKYLDPNIPYYKKGGVAKQWIYGYTFILSHFSKEINAIVAQSRDVFGIGHDEEVDSLVSALGKLSNKNALLIGEPGVGKSSLILGLAQRINSADVPLQLKDKRIIEFDLNGLIAISKKDGNTEELIIKAMNELEKAGNTILYIDEIQEIIPRKAEESGHSIAGILLPYILNSKFPIIGSINYSDYKKYFYSNESLRQSFTNIETKEVSGADALRILETKVYSLEKNFSCYITFPALVAAVDLAQRYIKERKLPSSAVQTIETTCSWAQSNGIDKITAEHVSKAISLQKNINITAIDQEESNRLMKLEENIKSRVVGQDEAVLAITEALRRARTDIRNPNKPIGTFLFIGPTGVGKTHLAKVVGEEFFSIEENIIRLDMSEYQDINSINKFLGSSGDENILGQSSISLVDKIKSNPYTVVLFDEIEKAHPQILDLFLQLFDEGRLTSNQGETVDFTNSIMICTSNIGSKILLDALEKDKSLWDEAKNRALLELRQSIKPELLNRFDKVIVFSPHDISNLSQIAILLLNDLAKRLSEKGITITWSDQIPMLIANKSNEPGMGARPMKRYIQDRIEGQIAKGLIENTIKSGEEISIKESWIV
ncbi:MAG: AAA family ATPase [Candidatus Dojkabacteria bacterium]